MRVKIVKDNKYHKKGEIIEVSPNVAFGLIDSGIAVVSKDMTEADQQVKGKKRGNRR